MPKMIVHAWLDLFNRTSDIQEKLPANCGNLRTKSMESCSLVVSQILAEFHPERAAFKTLHN